MKNGAPGGTRTPDHLVRSQVLYPTELQAHCSVLVSRLLPTFSGQRFALQVLASTLRVSAPAARLHPCGVRSRRSMLGLDASRQPSLTQLSYRRVYGLITAIIHYPVCHFHSARDQHCATPTRLRLPCSRSSSFSFRSGCPHYDCHRLIGPGLIGRARSTK